MPLGRSLARFLLVFVIDAIECLEALVIQYVIWDKGTEPPIVVSTGVLFDYRTFLQIAKHIYTYNVKRQRWSHPQAQITQEITTSVRTEWKTVQ